MCHSVHIGARHHHRTLEDGGAPAFVDMSVDNSDQERPVRVRGVTFSPF